ncbi:SDR family oxidoreductase [Vibrio lentus]|uniref:Short-chain dehydrogenase n=1 Tax=Vibrio lentus TaxID=136468 RepID=A0A855IT66_9VIBR|nr:SDR family oxidoreductase [Vibrio lentus]PMJ66925.1 short-chain dehydrogenase [Vibrio lentus]PMJ87957.1 short-chain dehydrogenase [Vibrio lentus]PMM58431.1 short-chain dehydrogenase [Vibrio lentus]PMM59327.1 short-chain dehydrogenase [Vibrio lentus]PMN35612.1 short-chain dehydrogenase [Vibrio lentus]
MQNIIIIGATSAMAKEMAKLYATEKANLYLIARDTEKLDTIRQDLTVRGANTVHTAPFDASQFESHQAIIEQAFHVLGCVDVLLVAHGSLSNQELCQNNAMKAIEELNTNGVSVISILTHAATKMEQQKSGNITVITSVAGDRGRQSNYVYGAAKSMVSTFLQGMDQRLSKAGVHVLDIKPGFVDTPMTTDFDKGALWEKPEKVAQIIKKRIRKKSSFSYTPAFWFVIMTIIKFIPKKIFKKIKL